VIAVGTVVPFARRFGWIVDLDLRGQLLRDAVPVLRNIARRIDGCSYRQLQRILQDELDSLPEQRPTGYVSALWRHQRLGLLPRLIAACAKRDGYVSLRGLDLLQYAGGGKGAQAVLKTTRDREIRERIEKAYWVR
jgi:hypothetical protein